MQPDAVELVAIPNPRPAVAVPLPATAGSSIVFHGARALRGWSIYNAGSAGVTVTLYGSSDKASTPVAYIVVAAAGGDTLYMAGGGVDISDIYAVISGAVSGVLWMDVR